MISSDLTTSRPSSSLYMTIQTVLGYTLSWLMGLVIKISENVVIILRNPALYYGFVNNNGADQPALLGRQISAFIHGCLDILA